MFKKVSIVATVLSITMGVNTLAAKEKVQVDFSKIESLGFKVTGEAKTCIHHGSLRRTEVIDNRTILFHMTGGKIYANIMKYDCYGLGFYRAIKYEVKGGTLCSIDTIEVLNNSIGGAHCGLGDFYEIAKSEGDARVEDKMHSMGDVSPQE